MATDPTTTTPPSGTARDAVARALGSLRSGPVEVLALDGDDTLWHNELVFADTQARFRALLAPFASNGDLDQRLAETEHKNLALFGYGVKGFTLSMIETALEVSGDAVPAAVVRELLGFGKAMLAHPVELLDGVEETVRALAATGVRLMVVTKGDLFHQESKLARSGLADLFWRVEIVGEKDVDTYRRITTRHGIDPAGLLMVGNSVRSDVLPVVELGGRAIHIPYEVTWVHEEAEAGPEHNGGWAQLSSISELPALVAALGTVPHCDGAPSRNG